jgi:hypothetical protein
MLDLTLDSRQGFACATTTKMEPLQVENYKVLSVIESSAVGGPI